MANATTATRGITYLRIRNFIGNHWNKVSRGAQNLRINEKVFQSAEIPPTESIYIILSLKFTSFSLPSPGLLIT